MRRVGWLLLVCIGLLGSGCTTTSSPKPGLNPCANPPADLAPNSLEALAYQQQCGHR